MLSAWPFAWLAAAGLLIGSSLLASGLEGAAMQLRPGAVRDLAPGKLLVAQRDLVDPNFRESVILLADYNDKGAMGLIINRQTETPLARVLPDLKEGKGSSAPVFFGGPVEAPGVLALLRSDAPQADMRHVLADVYLITSRTLLDQTIAKGTGPERFRVYVGYAGWGPGQLENETVRGSWQVFSGDAGLIFDPTPGSLWRRQISRAEALSASREEVAPLRAAEAF